MSTAKGIGVGEVIAAAGQLLATDFWSTAANNDATTLAGLGIPVSPYSSALAAWDGADLPTFTTSWATPSDNGPYRSAFVAEFLPLVVAATGVNAALIGYGHSGTDIGTYWLPGLQDHSNLFSVVRTAGGKFGTFIWCQGHSDADARVGTQHHLTSTATYLNHLQSFIDCLDSSFTMMEYGRILCSIPAIRTEASVKVFRGWDRSNPECASQLRCI